jgi:Na+/melibiose symporter-like transporter
MAEKASVKRTTVNMVNKLFYGIGDFGFNMVINTLGSVMMYFGTTVCNIPGTLMGLAIAIAMVWDAITDPIAGNISDGINNLLFGKRHGLMLIGIFGLSIANALLWSIPMTLPMWGKFLWILSFIVLLRTFSTMYQTPAAALGVEITPNINERTQIQSIRAIFLIIALIVPVILMSIFESKYGLGNSKIYKDVAYINSAICVVCGVIAVLGTYSYLPRLRGKKVEEKKEKFSLKKIFISFFEALKDNNVRSIIGGYTVSLMSIVFLSSLMIHVLQFTFMLDDIFVLMGAVFVMTIFSQPLWIFISKRFDKKTALFIGLITALIGTGGFFMVYLIRTPLITSGAIFWALLPCLSLMGAGAGAMYSMPLSMLGDTIAYKFGGKGEQKTGAYTGFTTLANKLSQSITLMIIGVLLDVVGFDGEQDIQSVTVQWALGGMLIVGIAAALAGGLLFYRKYSLKKEDILRIIEPQRNEIAQEDF